MKPDTTQSTSSRWPSKRIRRRTITFLRRVHLYLGLTLVPWVLLYGATALMFNHGDWFTDRDYSTLEPFDLRVLPTPETIATQAVEQLEQEQILLVDGTAKWIGPISVRGSEPGSRISARIHPTGRGGSLRVFPDDEPEPAWASALDGWSPLDASSQEQLTSEILSRIQTVRPGVTALTLRALPSVQFQVRDDERAYNVTLELGDDLEVQAAEIGTPLRSKLLRLHVLHGDPGYTGARWLWARIVDVMGVAMILWGLTGLVMWWTLRPTRRTGALALGLGVGVISVLATSLWTVMGMH